MEPAHVLVKVHADGYVEVLGPRHVRARVVHVPACQSILEERLMERMIDESLPHQYHFAGGELRATGYVRGMGDTYQEYMEKSSIKTLDMELLGCLKSMAIADSSFTQPQTAPQRCEPSTTGQAQSTSVKS